MSLVHEDLYRDFLGNRALTIFICGASIQHLAECTEHIRCSYSLSDAVNKSQTFFFFYFNPSILVENWHYRTLQPHPWVKVSGLPSNCEACSVGCFRCLPSMKNIATSINMKAFHWHVFISLGYIPWSEIAQSHRYSIYNYLMNCQTVFQSSYILYS